VIDDHARLSEQVAAYSLGALDEPERAAVAAHVPGCAECTRLLAEYQAVAGLLPHALPPQAPPPEARAALLARARRVRAVPAEPPAGSTARLVRLMRPLRWAAAILVIVGLLMWNLQLQLGGPREGLGIEQLARLPAGRVVALVGTGVPGASARLFVPPEGQQATVAVANLPPLAGGRTYQIWFARPGVTPQSGGIFQVNARGEALAPIVIPGRIDEFTITAVTEEPAGGSPRPTGEHLLDGNL
jgi:anti-sigma-K factor RskA